MLKMLLYGVSKNLKFTYCVSKYNLLQASSVKKRRGIQVRELFLKTS